MNSIADIIGPAYQSLIVLCERQKISLNLDITTPSRKIRQETALREFLKTTIALALKHSRQNGSITLTQTPEDGRQKFSLKYDGDLLDDTAKAQLDAKGYQHRSRFGYGNTISIVLS